MILNVILILIILKLSRCSLVLDSISQNTLYVSNYCPAMKYCKEGTHVMCMYYDHTRTRTIGDLCQNYVRVSITHSMVQQILKEVNEIRMKVASGKETGKDGIPLPRAYGMKKMYWDSELATLAQVLADQCLGLREDQCRATDKFSNPSQIITLINFKVPNWEYLSRNTTKRGLNKEKISFAIERALKSLHAVRRLVDADTINDCPPLEKLPDMSARSYLKLIRGKATHIGCGISAYTRYQLGERGSQNIYNSVQLVCNISDGPQQSQPLYTTDPPIPGTGFTEKCGCPHGYKDSVGCLCEKYPHNNNIAKYAKSPYQRQPNFAKDEYAPAAVRQDYDFKSSYHKQQQRSPSHLSKNFEDKKKNVVPPPIFEIQDAPTNSYEPDNDIELQFHRRFGNTSFIPTATSIEENEILDEVDPEIPKNRENKNRNLQHRKPIPNKPNIQIFKGYGNAATRDEVKSEKNYNGYISGVEDTIVDYYPNPRQNNDYDDKISLNNVYKDNDYTFLTILDHLEKAVKNIVLEGKERELFDIKMRKVYESALKTKTQITKIPTITTATTFEPDEVEDDFRKIINYLKQKSESPFKDDSVQLEPRNWSKDTNNLKNDFDKENPTYDYMDQKDNESDEFNKGIYYNKLIHILNKNKVPKRKHKYGYFNDKNDSDDYDDMDEDTNYPASRKQEKINKYDKSLKESIKGTTILGNRKHKILQTDYSHPKIFNKKNINNKKHKVNSDDEKERHTFNVDQTVKTFDRRTFSYPDRNVLRTHNNYDTPKYRRVYESENERPTLPMRQLIDKSKKITQRGTLHADTEFL